jgi:hypothetical protein
MRDTVATETPAALATSLMVGLFLVSIEVNKAIYL